MRATVGKLGQLKNKTSEEHPAEGSLYLTNTGQSYTQPKIDATYISQTLENKYIAEGLDKQQRILFQDDMIVSVVDKKTNEEDPDLTSSLTDMLLKAEFDFKIQQLWRDSMGWGPGICNPVWDYEGAEYKLIDIRRLDPLGFNVSGGAFKYGAVKNRILPGIQWNPDTNETEYYSKTGTGGTQKLENIVLFTDPLKTEVGGTPFIIPIVPLVKMVSFAWTAQMQKVNQHGSGGIWFIKVTNPKGDDKQYAQKILKNAGKNTQFQLRENMTAESLGVGQNGSALETITELGMQIRQFFSPAGIIAKDGALIGGSNESEYKLYLSYIKGTHRWLERKAVQLLDPWLRVNAYNNYRIIIGFPEPQTDKSEFLLKALDSAQTHKRITTNEARRHYTDLGLTLPELTGEELAQLDGQQNQEQMLQKAQLVVDAIGANEMDPEHLISEDDAKAILNKALGQNGKQNS